ncbi:MAG: ctpB 2 [Gemmataceae bacterium]|nr:ctpB 2 [Gemmataceae bacterium]
MLGFAGVGLLLLTPAAPVPVPPPPPGAVPADRNQATQFAHVVYQTGHIVREKYYPRKVEMKELIRGSIRGLYEEAGLVPPDDVLRTAARAGETELLEVLIDTRIRLGNRPSLSGPRALFAAVNGFRHATDPYCGLVSPPMNSTVSVDMDYGIGLELDGAGGQRWSVYRVEHGMATGMIPPVGVFGPLPKPGEVPSPASFPWRVKKVIPGSPAQRAGVKPGDVISQVDGIEITAAEANHLFARLAYHPGAGFDPNTGQPLAIKRTFKFRRAGTPAPITLVLETQAYTPEAVFGVIRVAEGKWDCMLDREYRIGYIRVGPIENKSDETLAEMLDDLTKRGCRGLILDLRWCPGGWVAHGTQIAGMFLKPESLIAEVQARPDPNGPLLPERGYRAGPPFSGKFLAPPLVVLVGSETMGGGELIAAALQDNGRCVVMGQRTVGRALIQNMVDTGFGGLKFKVTTGTTLRPNGKPRGKRPDSGPTDDWGIRPDPGLEVPVTADLSAQLRRWADEHALRPANSQEALPFDDPGKDPYRAAALAHLRKQLGRPVGAK